MVYISGTGPSRIQYVDSSETTNPIHLLGLKSSTTADDFNLCECNELFCNDMYIDIEDSVSVMRDTARNAMVSLIIPMILCVKR